MVGTSFAQILDAVSDNRTCITSVTKTTLSKSLRVSHCARSDDNTLKGVPVGPNPSRTITRGQNSEGGLKRRELGSELKLLDVSENL